MHDPMTVAFEIKRPWREPPSEFFREGYRPTWVTIWHVDPERDGSDDSCGWFARARHGDQAMLEKIRKAFEFEWDADYGGWFRADGSPRLSTTAIALNMFHTAAWEFFSHNRRRTDAFLKRHLLDLLLFAENNTDSLHDAITQKYGVAKREDRIENFAATVFGLILRAERPWYRHPRWHFWHWKVNVEPLQAFKRWAFSRCCTCGGRFAYGESPTTDQWYGKGPRWFRGEELVYHGRCGSPAAKVVS